MLSETYAERLRYVEAGDVNDIVPVDEARIQRLDGRSRPLVQDSHGTVALYFDDGRRVILLLADIDAQVRKVHVHKASEAAALKAVRESAFGYDGVDNSRGIEKDHDAVTSCVDAIQI